MSRGAPQHLEMFVDGRFEFPVAIICSGFFSFGAINRFFWKKIPYVAIFYCLGWLVGWLLFGTFRDVRHLKKLAVTLAFRSNFVVPDCNDFFFANPI